MEYPVLVYFREPPKEQATLIVNDNSFRVKLEKGGLVKEILPQLHKHICSFSGVQETIVPKVYQNVYTINPDYVKHSDFENFLKECFLVEGYELKS